MGFYYGPSSPPPSRFTLWRRKVGRYIPQFIKNWWDDVAEIFAITRVVLGIILPVFGIMVAFVMGCIAIMVIFSWFSSGGR